MIDVSAADTDDVQSENVGPEEKEAEDLLATARERFKLSEDAYLDIHAAALEDIKFSAGEQWPTQVKESRDKENRPCLTINRMPQFIHQLTNDQRQNRPAIKVSPTDDQADIETAKILQGMIRHIEYASNADTAYDTAYDSAVRGGLGYFRIVTEYCDPNSFEQEIRFKRIPNRFAVRFDPHSTEPDGSDSKYAFICEDYSKDEFKRMFPEAKLTQDGDWEALGNSFGTWITADTVRVAEYFYTDYKSTTIVQLVDAAGNKQVMEKDQLPKDLPEGVQVLDERETQIPTIKWCKINGFEVLEETEWLGAWIPIIPVYGAEVFVDGSRILEGIVRHSKDPQRQYNYNVSAETEAIGLAPRAPWIMSEGQDEGYEEMWATANTRNYSSLKYKIKTINGVPAPPPQRNSVEPAVQAITQSRMSSADDLKATTGIYDAALGAQGADNSGIAIQRRNIQSQTSNFHFMDNLSKSMRHGGRICNDLIPKIYTGAQATRILGEDGNTEIVYINKVFERNGKNVKYDLKVGKYDVAVSTGPGFETKRQEAVASMADLAKMNPQFMQFCGDLLVKSMDWPMSDEIADRLKKMLPPQLQGMDKNGQQPPIPPQAQQQMTQMNQMIQQLTEQLTHKTQQIESKTLELESKERIAVMQNQANIEIQLAKMKTDSAQIMLQHQFAEFEARNQLLRANQPVGGTNPGMPPMNQNTTQNPTGAGAQGGAPVTQVQQPTGGPSPG